MSEVPYFVQLDEALEICMKRKIKTETEELPLDLCHNRILATDLVSKVDDPPFDNSAMDGFAMRYEDTKSPPTTLDIICLLYTSPSPRDRQKSRMPSSA